MGTRCCELSAPLWRTDTVVVPFIRQCIMVYIYIYEFCILHFFFTVVVTIGFSETYYVGEDAGYISITVLVLMNSLARDVVVTLSTQDNTARGWFFTMPNLYGLLLTISSCM